MTPIDRGLGAALDINQPINISGSPWLSGASTSMSPCDPKLGVLPSYCYPAGAGVIYNSAADPSVAAEQARALQDLASTDFNSSTDPTSLAYMGSPFGQNSVNSLPGWLLPIALVLLLMEVR